MSKTVGFFRLGVIFAATLAFDAMSPAMAEQATCQLVSYASLDMRTLDDGRVTIPLRLGNRDVYFLVDTGGATSTIRSGIADALKLERRSSNGYLEGVGGFRNMNETVQLEDFSIGLLHGKGLKFFVDPNYSSEWAGILAPNLLRNFDLDFDFAGDRINLISMNPCPGSNIYWTKDAVAVVPMTIGSDGHIWIPVTVDGNKSWAMIDTGSRDSIMSISTARNALHMDQKDSRIRQSPVAANGARAFTFPFQSINFDGVSVSNPHILILSDDAMHNQNGIILGVGILRQLHMYISYKEKKMYLTAATAH